jgi:hypothetical protein
MPNSANPLSILFPFFERQIIGDNEVVSQSEAVNIGAERHHKNSVHLMTSVFIILNYESRS